MKTHYKSFIIICLATVLFFPTTLLFLKMPKTFREEQMQYSRVREAYEQKENQLIALAKEKGFPSLANDILIVGLKKERLLQVWAKQKTQATFALLLEYPFCTFSGTYGPKRQEGDLQIPEGFYTLNHFNPTSNFHLSLKVSYPNASDRILGTRGRLGGDIYIHGSCVTIGCIPITDEKIKELYVLAVEAKSNGQSTIPIYLFPCALTDESLNTLKAETPELQKYHTFWDNLKTGYQYFMDNKKLPKFVVDNEGKYVFQ